MGNVEDTAKVVKGIVEAVPVYEDVLQPASQEIGKTLGGTVKVALCGLNAVIWGYDKIAPWLEKAVEEKFQKRGVPQERVIPPKASIAGPIIEAMRFTADEPDLRELYAGLLATAMDNEAADKAHPAFVGIIKEITGYEAKVIHLLARDITKNQHEAYPLINLNLHIAKQGGYITLIENFTIAPEVAGLKNITPEDINVLVTNLSRIGLISTSINTYLTQNVLYDKLKNHPIIQAVFAKELEEGEKLELKKGLFSLTDFGKQFCKACTD